MPRVAAWEQIKAELGHRGAAIALQGQTILYNRSVVQVPRPPSLAPLALAPPRLSPAAPQMEECKLCLAAYAAALRSYTSTVLRGQLKTQVPPAPAPRKRQGRGVTGFGERGGGRCTSTSTRRSCTTRCWRCSTRRSSASPSSSASTAGSPPRCSTPTPPSGPPSSPLPSAPWRAGAGVRRRGRQAGEGAWGGLGDEQR